MEKNTKITINDIAREAKVSKATVSYVLNNKKNIKPETEQKVRSIIEKYGYSQSFSAKKISTDMNTNIIALILGVTNYRFLPYFSTFISTAVLEGKKHGKNVLVYFAESEESIINILKNNTAPIDGAILDICDMSKNIKDQLEKTTIPLVLIGRPDVKVGKKTSYCDADNEACTYKLTKAILKKGFRNPALFNVSQSNAISEDREKGFKTACDEYNVKGTIIVLDASEENFYNQTSLLLDNGCDSIITESTFFAESSYRAIKERGLQIGKDIAVCALGYSFDRKSDHNPHITFAEQNWKQISVNSVDLLCRILNNSKNKRHRIVKSKIHYQQSLLR